MKNIKVVSKDKEGITVAYKDKEGNPQTIWVNDITIIIIIETLCLALHKEFPEDYKFEE